MRIAAKFRSSSTSASTASICTMSAVIRSTGLRSSGSRSSPSFTEASAASLAEQIDAELRRHRNPARAVAEKAYLKSDLEFLGVGLPAMRLVLRSIKQQQGQLDREGLVRLTTLLWDRPLFEWRMMAVLLLDAFQPLLGPSDIRLLERLIRQSRTWAFVDELAIAVTGRLVERSPELVNVLERWSTDDDFWIRRAALLALLPPLRRGAGDFERFGRYADRMLDERESFIRKAIGWVLREAGKKRPELVYAWLLPRCGRASGITVREAVKYVSAQQRTALLAAYATGAHPRRASAHVPR